MKGENNSQNLKTVEENEPTNSLHREFDLARAYQALIAAYVKKHCSLSTPPLPPLQQPLMSNRKEKPA
jgi:hypothetical protein